MLPERGARQREMNNDDTIRVNSLAPNRIIIIWCRRADSAPLFHDGRGSRSRSCNCSSPAKPGKGSLSAGQLGNRLTSSRLESAARNAPGRQLTNIIYCGSSSWSSVGETFPKSRSNPSETRINQLTQPDDKFARRAGAPLDNNNPLDLDLSGRRNL